MIDVSELPAVRAQLERDIEDLKARHSQRAQALANKSTPQYARAPSAAGEPQAGARPPAPGSAR